MKDAFANFCILSNTRQFAHSFTTFYVVTPYIGRYTCYGNYGYVDCVQNGNASTRCRKQAVLGPIALALVITLALTQRGV